MEDLRWQQQLADTQNMHDRAAAAQAAFARVAKPFRRLELVESWRSQYVASGRTTRNRPAPPAKEQLRIALE
jgi:hypothetical protein